MKSYCSLRLEKILKKGLINKTLSSRILRYFDNTIPEIPECDLKMSVAHCDFSPGNVIVNEGNIGVIDFARAQPWSVFLDITHLYYQLNLLVYKYVFGKMFVNRLKDAFLRGYESTELKNNKLFTLFLIQNKLCKLVYFSRKEEHSFKSNLYHKIIINDTRRWFENIC
jgi:Ser/Thr protein kinase RdoA (MazF antagonist)